MTSKATSKSVLETFAHDLADPEFVVMYLEECLSDSPEIFFKALGDIARARGMTDVAAKPDGRGRRFIGRSQTPAIPNSARSKVSLRR
jgi:DNA-binding phage protein